MLELQDQLLRVRARPAALPAVGKEAMLVQRTGRMLIIGARRLNDTEMNLLRHRHRLSIGEQFFTKFPRRRASIKTNRNTIT